MLLRVGELEMFDPQLYTQFLRLRLGYNAKRATYRAVMHMDELMRRNGI